MKCFTIKSGNEYVRDAYKAITSSYYSGADIKTSDCEDEAKHYKTKSKAQSWIKTGLKKYTKLLNDNELLVNKYNNNIIEFNKKNPPNTFCPDSWAYNRYNKYYNSLKRLVDWLRNAVVIELDIDKPNYIAPELKVTWSQDNNKYLPQDKRCRIKLKIPRDTRSYCKSCGVVLKNVPCYEFSDAQNMKICVCCLNFKVDEIKEQFNNMDVKQRDIITNTILLDSI